ncbi:MAG TPA: ABC transporter permease [Vicinamibacterales bacterium]|nr:ABC transporter permease [Vicinamibacterales bacterium]
MHDLRQAIRQLQTRPGFSLTVILTLALGVGANTAMFSVVHGVLLRPLPFPEAERLATVWLTYPHWREREVLRQLWDAIPLAYPEYLRLREGTTSYEAVSIYRTDPMALTGVDRPEIVTVGSADDALPTVLGVGPAIGRWFSRTEAAPGGARLAVLTNAFWRTRFGGDAAVLGSSVHLDDRPYTIVGILPERFRFARPNAPAAPDVWIPVGALSLPFDDNNHVFDAIARLRMDTSFARAEEETTLLLRGERPPASRGARVVPRKEQEVAGVRTTLFVLWGAAALILLIASVNVANLLLGRCAEREQEFVVRHALGAGRLRIARQLGVESLLLAVAGGTAGALVAWSGTGALRAALPADLPRLDEIRVDVAVLGFAVAATLLAPLLFGVLPALLAGARATETRLRESGHRITGRGRLQHGLVGVQVALALALLVGAGLLTRSLAELWSVDTGFRRDGLLTFQISLPPTRYETRAAGEAFFARLASALNGSPGVIDVAMSSVLPLSGQSTSSSVWPASYGPERGPKPEVERRVVTPGYFAALGIPLGRGRAFTFADDDAAAPVMLISRAAAGRLWQGRDPLGDRVEMSDRWWTVVGIVEDVRDQTFRSPAQATVYVPSAQWPTATRTLIVRTAVPPLTLRNDMRRIVRKLDPELPITALRSMEQVAAIAVADERFRAGLLGGIAALAAVLAAVGLFGVMSHAVARRTRELGIRMALGAERNRVLRLVLRQAAVTVGAGLAAGVAVAVPASRVLDAFLFGVPRVDLVTYGGTAALMAAVALAAALVPAWRAIRVDPTAALRHE